MMKGKMHTTSNISKIKHLAKQLVDHEKAQFTDDSWVGISTIHLITERMLEERYLDRKTTDFSRAYKPWMFVTKSST